MQGINWQRRNKVICCVVSSNQVGKQYNNNEITIINT